MSWVAVAIGGSALLGAGASVYGANKAADASRRGSDAATGEQARQYDLTRSDFAPQRALGVGAVNQLGRLYGFDTSVAPSSTTTAFGVNPGEVPTVDSTLYQNDPAYRAAWDRVLADQKRIDPRGFFYRASEHDAARVTADLNRYAAEYRQANQPAATAKTTGPDMSAFFESPDFQFNLAEGQKAIDRSLAARGRALSGEGVKEGERFASGLASRQFGDFTNRLLTIAGLGNAATSATAAAGTNAANNTSAILMNNANNRASAYMTGAAGVNNAVQGGISNALLFKYLGAGTA